MQDGISAFQQVAPDYPVPPVRSGISLLWPALAGLALTLTAGAMIARLMLGPRFDGLLLFAAGVAAVIRLLRLVVREPASTPAAAAPIAPPHKSLFDSAGPG